MIQCPICQVLNEDAALFCAECGQRFNQAPAGSAPGQPPPNQPAPPHRPPLQAPQQPPSQLDTLPPDIEPKPSKGLKLRSPVLGVGDDEDEGYEKPQMSKLRGTSGARKEGSTTGKKHLRSPLLGGDDDDEQENFDDQSSTGRGRAKKGAESAAAKKKRLRSPLLGEDDDDDDADDDFAPEPGAKGGKHLRSPLLGDDHGPRHSGGATTGGKPKLRSALLGGGGAGYDDDDDYEEKEPPRASSKKGLRSPILGGDSNEHTGGHKHKGGLHSPLLGDPDDYDDDEPPTPRRSSSSGPATGGKPKLRSALLGGGYDDDYDDDWDDDDEDDEDNPEVLRSPLLAAKKRKRPKQEVAHAPEVPHTQGHPGAPQMAPHQPPAQQMPHQPPAAQHIPQRQPGAPAFPGPAEPQPPWQNAGAPPVPGAAPPVPGAAPQGWPAGAQPQPGQPWPPQGVQPPIPQNAPPLPAEATPGAPPWQNRMNAPSPAVAGRGADVPPIVDDNDEFQLDIPEPGGMSVTSPAFAAPHPGAAPQAGIQHGHPGAPVQESPSRAVHTPEPPKRPRRVSDDDAKGSDLIDDEIGPKDRRIRVERRKMPDRRFSSLIDEKGSSSATDFDDDFSVDRPQPAAANKGMAQMMLGLGAMALGFKIYEFIKVMGMWDLSKLPEFVAEQLFSGLAIVCLIVLALSCMKK